MIKNKAATMSSSLIGEFEKLTLWVNRLRFWQVSGFVASNIVFLLLNFVKFNFSGTATSLEPNNDTVSLDNFEADNEIFRDS